MIFARAALIAAVTLFVSSVLAAAQDPGPPPQDSPSSAPATPMRERGRDDLTPEERAEKQSRKACKIKICDILSTKDPQGDDVSCDIVKTWREADITKMLGGRFTWSWGNAVCQSKLDIKREQLVKAMTETNYDVAMPEHTVRCALAQKSQGEPYAVEVAIAPKVTFENGKAVSARINWGEAKAPTLAYALIYAGTGFDNSTNVLGPEVVRMVNEFTGKKCRNLRDEMRRHAGSPPQ
jgi:hypothetical protein